MRQLLRQHPMAFALAVIAALLALVVALEAGLFGVRLWAPAAPAPAKGPPSAEAKLVPPLAAVNPEQAYPESAARPPFSPTRRPAPPPVTQPASTMNKGQFTLMGIIAIGAQRTALLREKANGRIHRVERGKEVNGLTLATVENDHVTLVQGSEQELLPLQVQRGPAVAAAPVPAPAAAAGPFAPQPGAAPAAVAAGAPPPAPPQAAPVPPVAAPAAGAPTPNPAARSGFGPYAQPTPAPAEPAGATLTPEELLARRRARRAQQQEGNQR